MRSDVQHFDRRPPRTCMMHYWLRISHLLLLSYRHEDLLTELVGPSVQEGQRSSSCVCIILQPADSRRGTGGIPRSVSRQHVQHGNIRTFWQGMLLNAKARTREVVAKLAMKMVDVSMGGCTSDGHLRLEW